MHYLQHSTCLLSGEVSFLIYLTPTEHHSHIAVLCNIQLRGDLRLQYASILGPNVTVGLICCFQMRHLKCQIISYLSFKRAMSAGLVTIQGIYRTPEETQNPPLRFLHCVQHLQGQINEKPLSEDKNMEAALLLFFSFLIITGIHIGSLYKEKRSFCCDILLGN